jgi:E3 ubiquitin-protein ligase TRIP12
MSGTSDGGFAWVWPYVGSAWCCTRLVFQAQRDFLYRIGRADAKRESRDLAGTDEQTMEKISSEHPSAVVKEGGLGALLNYLDFFSTNVQRTAVNAAANCCRNLSGDSYQKIKDVFPTLRQTLTSTDQRLVESATLAVVRTIEAFRHNPSHLEGLLDLPTAIAINSLLMPSGGSPLLSPATYTHLLKALTSSARGSAKVTVNFLEAGMTSTIYQILTGVLPPSHDEDEQGESAGGQGLAGGVADMAVLQNLAHRPKDQVEEALALITELLPPLPKEGVFDPKGYTEKAFDKIKQGSKAGKKPRRSSRTPKAAGAGVDSANMTPPEGGDMSMEYLYETPPTPEPRSDSLTELAFPSNSSRGPDPSDYSRIAAEIGFASSGLNKNLMAKSKKAQEQQMDQRLEMLKMHPDLVAKFVKTILPVLVDVYAASVAVRVRTKVLSGLTKAVAFTDAESLKITLRVSHSPKSEEIC